MSAALNGWHRGESAIRAKLGTGYTSGFMATAYTWIEASMPEQHRVFYARNVPFIPLTILDAKGRLWAALVSGPRSAMQKPDKMGQKNNGFEWVKSPSETELVMDLESWEGDPMFESLDAFDAEIQSHGRRKERKTLVAGLGIEFPTRRRNKFAGWIEKVEKAGPNIRRIWMHVNQAIGNCPKYINVRTLDPYPDATSQVVYRRLDMEPDERLPSEIVDFILCADTVFFGTSYEADESDKERYPSHVGMNARGGRPGFVRVRPSDGRTLVLPDYSGNRLMTSLGNVEATSRAAMTFLDFATGSILYLSGIARNLVGTDAQSLMPRQNVLTTLFTEAFIFVRDALPIRQRPGTDVERSPYSPPIKFLAEEKEGREMQALDDVFVTLARIQVLSHTLATFTFETDKPVKIHPGQAAALDFADLLGTPEYAHMAPGNEISVNDDRVRTWTVSSCCSTSSEGETKTFDLTMREKPGGLVTGALFTLARHAEAKMPDVLDDARPLGLRVRLAGITGSFTLPSETQTNHATVKMLWIAGGIGVTPFLSMLSFISSTLSKTESKTEFDIVLILTTREPRVLLNLIRKAFGAREEMHPQLRLTVHIFGTHHGHETDHKLGSCATVHFHQGRPDFSKDGGSRLCSLVSDVKSRTVYLCGPARFEEDSLEALELAGVERTAVLREGFDY